MVSVRQIRFANFFQKALKIVTSKTCTTKWPEHTVCNKQVLKFLEPNNQHYKYG